MLWMLRSTEQVKCTSCGFCSNTYEPFLDLSLEIHGKVATLEEAMARFTAVETLDKANRWKCSSCAQLVCAKKQLTVYCAPNVCTVQLKRCVGAAFSSFHRPRALPSHPHVLKSPPAPPRPPTASCSGRAPPRSARASRTRSSCGSRCRAPPSRPPTA